MDAEDRRTSDPAPEQLRELLEPDGIPRIERLGDYIRRYRERYVFDTRTALFDVRHQTSDEVVVLEGLVGNPGLKDGLVRSLSALGLTVRAESLRAVTDTQASGDRYALVSVSRSFLCASPDLGAEAIDETLLGEPLILMEGTARPASILVQGQCGYLGWISDSDIRIVDRETWRLWHCEERVIFDCEMELGQFAVPIGAELPVRNGDIYLPDQTSVSLPDGLKPIGLLESRNRRNEIVRRAESLLGTKYVWAGRSGAGLDCSGFVQMLYGRTGIHLPRDADQQHLVGRVSADPVWRNDLAPGDLLFFTGPMGNITHVGISTGELEFIHAKGGSGVVRGSFDHRSSDYNESLDHSFLVAKRIIQ
ncbi:MAG: C40 family peptidase [bacterium]